MLVESICSCVQHMEQKNTTHKYFLIIFQILSSLANILKHLNNLSVQKHACKMQLNNDLTNNLSVNTKSCGVRKVTRELNLRRGIFISHFSRKFSPLSCQKHFASILFSRRYLKLNRKNGFNSRYLQLTFLFLVVGL